MLPREMSLSQIEPLRPRVGARSIEINRAVSGRPLAIGGERYENGIGTRGNAEIEYDLRGLFDSFSALVGVDDGTNDERASVEFVVVGDGKELWRSGVLKKSDGAKPLRIDLSGVRRLVLRVSGGGDTTGRTQSDWVDVKLRRRENVAPK
jgi:alpha-galactosidase